MNTTNSSKRKTVLAGLVGLFAAGGMTQAVAQGGEAATGQSAIDEIIVTATKREEKLIDVPISIAVLTGEKIENAGIQNITDLSYAIPNLSVWERGPGLQTITIRGVGNQRGSSSLVGIYLDDMPASSFPDSQLDLQAIDLERVEVLRGPQGTLYGQGSVGGTVRFITKQPSYDGVSGSIGTSSYHTQKGGWSEELTGILNAPVIDDVLAFRLAASYKNKDGWIDQPAINAKDINDSELTNIRLRGIWQASENSIVHFSAIRHRNDGGGTNIVNLDPVSESLHQVAVDPTLSPSFTDDYDIYNVSVNFDLGFATLKSLSSYIDIEKQLNAGISNFLFFSFAPTTLVEGLVGEQLQQGEIFTQEISLGSDTGPLDWTVGVFYSDSERHTAAYDFELAFGGVVINTVPVASDDFRFSKSTAFFGDLSYEFTDRLTIGIGTRYFEDDRDFKGIGLALAETFDNLSSKVYLSYALSNDASLYASISEGFRSGGFNDSAGVLNGGAPSYDPEDLTSYELGVKSVLLDKTLSAEVAIYFSEYNDYQALAADLISGGSSIFNVGEAEIKGIELNIQWLVSEQLSIGLSGNVTDAEITKVTGTSPTQFVGDPLDYVPDYNYSLNFEYTGNWTDTIPGFIRLDYNVQGENGTSSRNSGFVQDVAYSGTISLLNAHVGLELGGLAVELFGKNLLNEDDLTTASIARTGPQERPRTFGIKLDYDF